MFRFTIRELVLVTVIVAMGVAWGLDRARLAARVSFLQRGSDVVMEMFTNCEDGPLTVTIDDRSWPY